MKRTVLLILCAFVVSSLACADSATTGMRYVKQERSADTPKRFILDKRREAQVNVPQLNGYVLKTRYQAYALPQFYASGAFWSFNNSSLGFYSRGRNDSMGLMYQKHLDSLDATLVTTMLYADTFGGSRDRGSVTVIAIGIVKNF